MPDSIDWDSVIIVVLDERQEIGAHGLKYHANMGTMWSNVLEMI